jgi:hypothetical protein
VCVEGPPRTCRVEYPEWENMPSYVQRDAVCYGARWRCWRSIAPPESISRAMCVKACVIASPHDKAQCVPACRILLACTREVSSRISAEASLEALNSWEIASAFVRYRQSFREGISPEGGPR